MRDLIQPFQQALGSLVRGGDRLVVAVSGGGDSLALLDLAARASARLRLGLVVAHVDHGWRAESGDEARFVAEAARARGLGFAGAELGGSAIGEAAARTARRRFFGAVAAAHGASGVLLGHTADDQAETVMLHLLRGSGVAGLAGMRAETTIEIDGRPLRLLRPLLSFDRAELRAYCRAKGLDPREDPSNAEPRFLRNRVRHELLPLMSALQPRAVAALVRLAEVAADETAIVQAASDAAWEGTVAAGPRGLVVDRPRFRELGGALQRATLRRIAAELLGPSNDLTLERVEAARQLLIGGRGGAVLEWPGRLRMTVERLGATFAREE